ncbi:MAG: hypothetical protein JJ872_06410 [Marivivens sp.]|jgi:hypothetical protein|nr:hypothetical protein [Marivivens sp.]
MVRFIALLTLALGIAGCTTTVDTASRATPLDMPLTADAGSFQRSYAVQDVQVMVPESLSVSEANSYYPIADIVWRGDLFGDRHQQIELMFENAASLGAETLEGDIPVIVQVVISRFHGVTERTRFSVGGSYHMVFDMTVLNAETGVVIEGPRTIDLNLAAPGGQAAIELERMGQTEKVRVTTFLTQQLYQELGGAGTAPAIMAASS